MNSSNRQRAPESTSRAAPQAGGRPHDGNRRSPIMDRAFYERTMRWLRVTVRVLSSLLVALTARAVIDGPTAAGGIGEGVVLPDAAGISGALASRSPAVTWRLTGSRTAPEARKSRGP